MIDLAQNILLQLNVLHLLILQNDVFPDALHRVELFCGGVLYQEHFAKGALADHLTDLEVLESGWLRLISGKDSCGATSHGLAHFVAILIRVFR